MSNFPKCEDCGLCCIQTEMLLSARDIKRIQLNYFNNSTIKDFFFKNEDGLYQMTNMENNCYFFNKNDKSCRIYDIRPKGCKFYPMIYDINKKQCILDGSCPRTSLFYTHEQEFKKTCMKLKKFVREELLNKKSS